MVARAANISSSYEECRLRRLEENKKRMEALNLPNLARALTNTSPLKSSPVISIHSVSYLINLCTSLHHISHPCLHFLFPQLKVAKRRKSTADKQSVVVRRSSRFASKPAPDYKEVTVVTHERVTIPRRTCAKKRDLSNRVYASDEARADALEKAEKLESSLEATYPTFIKSMLQSHVSGGFWLGLPTYFCKKCLPKNDEVVTLVDESGNESPTIYLARKSGLSGGWKGFAVAHDLADGDAVVFQLIKRTTFKVYIIRVNSS